MLRFGILSLQLWRFELRISYISIDWEMAGRFVVGNGGKICGGKWREDLRWEMAGRHVVGNGGKTT
jgi:hypothetical protein